jgi:hypothetical protein
LLRNFALSAAFLLGVAPAAEAAEPLRPGDLLVTGATFLAPGSFDWALYRLDRKTGAAERLASFPGPAGQIAIESPTSVLVKLQTLVRVDVEDGSVEPLGPELATEQLVVDRTGRIFAVRATAPRDLVEVDAVNGTLTSRVQGPFFGLAVDPWGSLVSSVAVGPYGDVEYVRLDVEAGTTVPLGDVIDHGGLLRIDANGNRYVYTTIDAAVGDGALRRTPGSPSGHALLFAGETYQEFVSSFAVDLDGSLLVTGTPTDGIDEEIQRVDTVTGVLAPFLDLDFYPHAIEVVPSPVQPGDLLVYGKPVGPPLYEPPERCGGALCVIDHPTGAIREVAAFPTSGNLDVTFESYESALVLDRLAGALLRIDLATGEVAQLPDFDGGGHVAVAGERIFATGAGGIFEVDPVTGTKQLFFPGDVSTLAVTPSGSFATHRFEGFDEEGAPYGTLIEVDLATGAASELEPSYEPLELVVAPNGDRYLFMAAWFLGPGGVSDWALLRTSGSPSGALSLAGGLDPTHPVPAIALDAASDLLFARDLTGPGDFPSGREIERHDAANGASSSAYELDFPVLGLDVVPGGPAASDRDADLVPDHEDNCPDAPNPRQEDADADGTGDACGCVEAGATGWLGPTTSWPDPEAGRDGFERRPEGAHADGGAFARNRGGAGDGHVWSGFGAGQPLGCAVRGVEVLVDWRLDSKRGRSSLRMELSFDGGATWGAPRADLDETRRFHTAILGGASDLWGQVSPAPPLEDGSFVVRVTPESNRPFRDFYLDRLAVRLHYGPEPRDR